MQNDVGILTEQNCTHITDRDLLFIMSVYGIELGPVNLHVWVVFLSHQDGFLQTPQAVWVIGTLPTEVKAPANVAGHVWQTKKVTTTLNLFGHICCVISSLKSHVKKYIQRRNLNDVSWHEKIPV